MEDIDPENRDATADDEPEQMDQELVSRAQTFPIELFPHAALALNHEGNQPPAHQEEYTIDGWDNEKSRRRHHGLQGRGYPPVRFQAFTLKNGPEGIRRPGIPSLP